LISRRDPFWSRDSLPVCNAPLPGEKPRKNFEVTMQHEIKVNVGFDADGFEKAVQGYLMELVESGAARYDQETYDLIVARAEAMVGDFVKTETVTVTFV
jgi:hypothetical protein